jgi:hypothetical protein
MGKWNLSQAFASGRPLPLNLFHMGGGPIGPPFFLNSQHNIYVKNRSKYIFLAKHLILFSFLMLSCLLSTRPY